MVNIVVIGLGKTGHSCVDFLMQRGANVAVMDTRIDPPGIKELQNAYPEMTLSLGGLDQALLLQADQIVISPGIALSEPAIAACLQKGIPVIGDIELFTHHAKKPILAITGSNGKTTVTTLVGEMLKAAGIKALVGGNIGTPVLNLLEQDTDAYVLELSSFQLETTYSLVAKTAVCLNVSPDHLDRYADYNSYIAAKKRIYLNCEYPVINRQDPLSYEGVKFIRRPVSFGLDKPEAGQFGIIDEQLMFGDQVLMSCKDIALTGRHQWANALAAIALVQSMNVAMKPCLETLKTFKGLDHRCQFVAQIEGVDWYNDSKGTNVGATQAAVNGIAHGIQGKIVLIAGGQSKNADLSELADVLKQHVRSVVLMGEAAKEMQQLFAETIHCIMAESLQDAVELSAQAAQAGDAVLLSPACASFDMFDSYIDRGQQFMQAVQARKGS